MTLLVKVFADCYGERDWVRLMPITGILLRMMVSPLAFLVATSFNLSRIFENHTNKYFHVVPRHHSINIKNFENYILFVAFLKVCRTWANFRRNEIRRTATPDEILLNAKYGVRPVQSIRGKNSFMSF